MKKYFDILQNCPLFCGIKPEDLEVLLSCLGAKHKSYCKKETIFAEGDKAQYIGIVLCGSVQIERTDYDGNRSIVANVGPSQLFGESFACCGEISLPVDVTAAEVCEVLLIDCSKIIHSCANACSFHSRMIFNLLKIMALKNIFLNQKAEIAAKRSTREKLMTYLMLEARKNNSSVFTIPYDRQQLADYLNVDRSGLSVQIGRLCKEGIIKARKNRFELLNT